MGQVLGKNRCKSGVSSETVFCYLYFLFLTRNFKGINEANFGVLVCFERLLKFAPFFFLSQEFWYPILYQNMDVLSMSACL